MTTRRIVISSFRIIGLILLFLLLTLLTQTGGIEFLLFWLLWRKIRERFTKKWLRISLGTTSFLAFHAVFAFLIIPLIAPLFGRKPLPIYHENIQPLNLLTCSCNRHYVKPELYDAILNVSTKLNEENQGSIVAYLDAGFPFMEGFPLFPHLSHDDGEKIDLALFYVDAKSGQSLNLEAPSFIGYGVYESPKAGESNQPLVCDKKGYWQYDILSKIVPQWHQDDYQFDEARTQKLLQLLSNEKAIKKIFIEPHLKNRMYLNSSKIRYHGCQAVRHDDHIHVEL